MSGITRDDAEEYFGFNSNNVARPQPPNQATWSFDKLRNAIPKLNSRSFRFPPGGDAKYWDINTGWLLNSFDVSPFSPVSALEMTICLNPDPRDTADLTRLPFDRLYDFRAVLGGSDASALMVLNLFQKDSYQMQMIQHGLDLQLPLSLVELGNEFYINGNICPFYQPEDYAAMSNHYLDLIHNTHNFPVNVGVVFSIFTSEYAALNDDCRRISWNASLGLPDTSLLNNLRDHDAFTFHIYPRSGIKHAKPDVYDTDVAPVLASAFQIIDSFANTELKILPEAPLIDAWITEFDLREKEYMIHGTWAHGLYKVAMCLRMLEHPEIRFVFAQTMAQDGAAGALFENASGFDFEGFETPGKDIQTQTWGFTAGGLTLKIAAEAMRNSNEAIMLNFTGSPNIGGSEFDAFYGWQFNKDNDTQVVILNLSPETKNIYVSSIFPNGGAVEQISSEPLYYLTGQVFNIDSGKIYSAREYIDATINNWVDIDSTNISFSSNQYINLRPYSITRIYKTGQVHLVQSESYVCAHDALDDENPGTGSTAINVYMSGASFYELSNQPNVIYPSSISISPPASNTTYTLYGFAPDSTVLDTVNFTVNVNSQPVVTVTQLTTNCSSNTFVASGANAYNWWGTQGVSDVLNDTVTIVPSFLTGKKLKYIAMGIRASDGCTKQIQLNLDTLASFEIKSPANSLPKLQNKFFPAYAAPCLGDTLTMLTSGTAISYKWNASDGSVVDVIAPQLKVAPDKGVLYSVEGASSDGCTFTRFAWVLPQPQVVNLRDGHVFTCADTCTQIKLDIGNDCDTCGFSWQPIDSLYKNDACSQTINSSYKNSYSNVRFLSSTADTFNYTAYGIDSSLSCLEAGSVAVTIYVQDAQSITLNATDVLVFEGATDTLFASPDTLGDYTWIGCSMDQTVGDTITIHPKDTCTYTVITNNEGCCSWDSITIYTIGLEADCGGGDVCTGCTGTIKVLTTTINANPGGTFNYMWYYKNGDLLKQHLSISTPYDTIQIKVDIADTFYCKVSGTNVAGLGHTNDVIVKKSYLPPGWECASAIIYEKQNRNQQSLATLKVYPNPTTGKFMIEFNESRVGVEDVVVELRALVGNMLEQYHLQSTNGYLKKELDLQQPAGIYLISVCSKNDCITQKLIIAQ